jgi:hypothetical protein
VLAGRASLEDALVGVELSADIERGGSLRILRAGTVAQDPGELVASEQLRSLFDQLRSLADVVYVDTPPMLRAGDALEISGACDFVFLVAKISSTRRPAVVELTRLISRCPVPVVGFVATGSEPGKWAYSYRTDRYATAQGPASSSAGPEPVSAEPDPIPEPASVESDPVLAAAAAVAAAQSEPHGDATPAHAEDHSAARPVASAARPVATSGGASGPNRAALVEFFRSRRAKRQG